MLKRTAAAAAIILCLLSADIFAADGIAFESEVDWKEGILQIRAQVDLAAEESFIPAARRKSERLVEQQLPFQFRDTLAGMVVDSYNTAGELAEESPELVRAINGLTYRNTKTFSHISSNLQNFSVTYSYYFYPEVIDIFIRHRRPYRPDRQLKYTPTTDFTGIVIYMKDDFPVHGERREAQLVPCLFPRILDEDLRQIYEKGMVEPDYLRSWGMVAYSEGLDERKFEDRVGLSPLRILGRGIFGKYDTDVIIDRESAEMILYSPNNRRLLAEGRVLIICDLPD
jgi:hypothetical protein